MPVLSAPRLRLWPPRAVASKAEPAARGWMICADGADIYRHADDAGQGVATVAAGWRGPDPPERCPTMIAAAAGQCRRARTSVARRLAQSDELLDFLHEEARPSSSVGGTPFRGP
jgi:hypothetical protein